MKYALLVAALMTVAANHKGPFSVKKQKTGPKTQFVEILGVSENAQGLVEIQIDACGTSLIFVSPKSELESPDLNKFVVETVDSVCR